MNYEKEIRKARYSKYIVTGIFAVLFLAVMIAGIAYEYHHTFSTSRWLANPGKRTAIVDDLLEKYELVGMTEADVTALLGEPDNDYGYFTADNRYVYYMGEGEKLISFDSEWLILDFTDGIVSDYYIRTD